MKYLILTLLVLGVMASADMTVAQTTSPGGGGSLQVPGGIGGGPGGDVHLHIMPRQSNAPLFVAPPPDTHGGDVGAPFWVP